ncbi:MAG: hypothetical protein AB7O59_04825 [Pirellulales bacterium]
MRRLILPLAMLAMGGLLFAAMAWDCVRLAADARQRVAAADEEMQKHETRLVKLLSTSPRRSAEVQTAIETYQAAGDPQTRHGAYEQLVASFRQSMSAEIDATNPLDRKFMDDVAGALNRREIAERQYDDEWARYQAFLGGVRGGLARWFSSAARDDWKPGG